LAHRRHNRRWQCAAFAMHHFLKEREFAAKGAMIAMVARQPAREGDAAMNNQVAAVRVDLATGTIEDLPPASGRSSVVSKRPRPL